MSNVGQQAKKAAAKRSGSQEAADLDMAATVFEPVKAEVRPAECHSTKRTKAKKAKPKSKEALSDDKEASEVENLKTCRAMILGVQPPSPAVSQRAVVRPKINGKHTALPKKSTEPAEDRISEQLEVAEEPAEKYREQTNSPYPEAHHSAQTKYKIVYSASKGKQIPRFVPDVAASKNHAKLTENDERTAFGLDKRKSSADENKQRGKSNEDANDGRFVPVSS